MWLMALGVDPSALEEVFNVSEITIRTWLCRSGIQGKKLHERFMLELDLIHVQLDELVGQHETLQSGYVGLGGQWRHHQDRPGHPGRCAYPGNGLPDRTRIKRKTPPWLRACFQYRWP